MGDKLAEFWKELRFNLTSFDRVDDESAGRESIEKRELEADNAVDDARASTAVLSTPHSQRSGHRRADQAPESPLPTATAEFD